MGYDMQESLFKIYSFTIQSMNKYTQCIFDKLSSLMYSNLFDTTTKWWPLRDGVEYSSSANVIA